MLKAGDSYFHKECFVCSVCEKTLVGAYTKGPDGKLFCPDCVPKRVCEVCKGAIGTSAARVGDKLYHPECFKCSDCSTALTDFYTVGDKVLCKPCAERAQSAPEEENLAPAASGPGPVDAANEQAEVEASRVPTEAPAAPIAAAAEVPTKAPEASIATPADVPTKAAEKAPEVAIVAPSAATFTLTLAELNDSNIWKSRGVDPACREQYLSDDEFQKHFGVTKAAFEGQPKWKREKLKKEKGLF
jgi:hypothetical protein